MPYETTAFHGPVPCPEEVEALRGTTEPMRRALMSAVGVDGVQWDAEFLLGIKGASFWAVLDALRKRGLVDDEYCLTPLGQSVRRLIRHHAGQARQAVPGSPASPG